MRQADLAQVVHGAPEARDELLASSAGFVLFEQQITEALLEAVDPLRGGMFRKILREPELLLGLQVVAVRRMSDSSPAVLRADWIDLAPAGQEMLINQARPVLRQPG